MDIYTIGFTKKTAKKFFELLVNNGITKVIDIRLNTKSQLAGFAKTPDLQYFLELHGIAYEHDESLAPTPELLDRYKDKKLKMKFADYTTQFKDILQRRNCIPKLQAQDLDHVCFLCSEDKADECHRRLVVESIMANRPNIKIIHL